ERPMVPAHTDYNYAYYPVILRDHAKRETLMAALAAEGIHGRRYFFPSLDTLPYVRSAPCSNSQCIADRVLCLPLYVDLDPDAINRIARIIGALE
ncbi:MAG TPA: DegT/DnrJ/EryC1/StrS family aminotransferase, partial [Flavobacteriales bacterium]|nr:DegT/DnrJ/EryC1/StrS family aminotransferase [Flavobacteriales bacterium]